MTSVTRPTSSFTEAVQQEQNQAEKAWVCWGQHYALPK
jgi:hypothetical protein